MNRFFRKNPWLITILGIVVLLNNWIKFAPGQVLQGMAAWLVPILLIAIGIIWTLFGRRSFSGE